MADPRRDDSISPLTSPRAASPAVAAPSEQQNAFVPPKRVDSLIRNPAAASEPSLVRSPGLVPEAGDYLNGGKPHDDPRVGLENGSKPASRPSPAPLEPVAKDATTENGSHTPDISSPPGRRSVQFARADVVVDPPPGHTRHSSWEDGEGGKSRGASFMSKLKALAVTGGLQTPKSPGFLGTGEQRSQSMANSPTVARWRRPSTLNEENASDEDADAEETADESAVEDSNKAKKKKKRKIRRFEKPGNDSTPNTPIARFSAARRQPDSPNTDAGPRGMARRRASMPESDEHQQHGLSEGEGREQLRDPAWRRGSSWISGTNRSLQDDAEEGESPVGRRIGHLRRITVFGGGGVSDGDAMTPRRPIFSGERASTFGAQKWNKVKSTLRLLRQKKDERFDFAKSAELMAELRAGAPAVLMLASMIQRDEHGNKRIPVLLEQVKLHISESTPMPDDDSERHWVFTMDLEYGSGPSRMKWTVIRTLRDIYNLHLRYKFALSNEKYLHLSSDVSSRPKQPKFPWAAFPYLRGARKKDGDSDEEDLASVRGDDTADGTAGEGTADGTASDADPRMPLPRRRTRNLLGIRRKSTGFTDTGNQSIDGQGNPEAELIAARKRYVERQRRVLEKYLQEMIRWLMFRADSNRLCRFLELSALGVRLAAEGSYHGKECYLHIQSSKGLDFRRVLTPKKVIARHSRKWFLVRQSYIVCVESPENMNVYDVYLVDSKFRMVSKKSTLKQIAAKAKNEKHDEIDLTADELLGKHHTLTLHTAERKVKLFSRYQSIMRQFEESVAEMLKQTPWHLKNRFDSYAPIRTGVFAQWLVDGRDYMWNVSRAINMARDVIYIHDWWLSPELYMRRPAAISQKWRLDRLLQRKAREGVKIFVIVYRNVEAAIPIDSEYTKYSLLNLHPNIFVQRSPNQFKKNQFFFAHHEKLCIVDHDIAFAGGLDLCFGRWDCPEHPLTDDKATGFEPTDQPKDAEHCQLFPGKDYSNPRVQDFFRLNEPYEEMHDRSTVPRMPWHDIGMQMVGQPARDLTRHFVQRWNYLRRGRKPTRPLPFLLPPPDARPADLEAMGLTGTCEVQILRSASTWSLGITETEQSIHHAYIKMIEDSEHFVYMENQFFITSTETFNTKMVNRVGDALVERIIRAHEKDEDWKCCIVIPLLPGFQNTVDEQEGTSVRLILQCQFRSICRGENSIFGRLRAAGIEPEDYIQFYSLRTWAKIGPKDVIVTEQLYIHAKAIIVDDRVALIGSANINERSLLGNRDSEVAAIVRDTDMIWSTMGGKPYRVGRFAHTLRLRLMREHLGLDVDEILEQERQVEMDHQEVYEAEMDQIYSDESNSPGAAASSSRLRADQGPDHPSLSRVPSFNHDVDLEESRDFADEREEEGASSSKGKERATESRVNSLSHRLDVTGFGPDHWKSAEKLGLDQGRDSVIVNGREVLVHNIIPEGHGTLDKPKWPHEHQASTVSTVEDNLVANAPLPPLPLARRTTTQMGLPRPAQLPTLPAVDDTDIGGPPAHFDEAGRPSDAPMHPLAADITLAHIDKDCMRDPLNTAFFDETWNRVAENNTKIYRRVFRCHPDSEVHNWNEYNAYVAFAKQFKESMDVPKTDEKAEAKTAESQKQSAGAAAGGVGVAAPGPTAIAKAMDEKVLEKLPFGKPEGHGHLGVPSNGHGHINGDGNLDEKQGLRPQASRTNSRRSNFGADLDKPLPDRPMDAPSPVLPGGDTPFPAFDEKAAEPQKNLEPPADKAKERRTTFTEQEKPKAANGGTSAAAAGSGSVRRRRRTTTKSRRGPSEEPLAKGEAEELLNLVQGNLVAFPYDWLITEESNGNWLYQVDGVAPLQIYN